MKTFTDADLVKAKRYGLTTPNGVAYDWWLASSAGAGFALYREPHHTDEDIEAAKAYLRAERDVVEIRTYTKEK
jgi:hypothetical protein